MNRSRIFLSHAGSESDIAQRVADRLNAEGLEPVLDRERLSAGLSFIAFMENALATSDFCLLLWSAAAATRKWVEQEWQSALHRSVEEARAFLTVGRVDDHPLPALLRPRLYVELHPQLDPGLAQLVDAWRGDRAAEERSQKPVASMPLSSPAPHAGETVYVTSELFGITLPWRADLEAPAGMLLDAVRQAASLPVQIADPSGRTGIRYEYSLMLDDQPIERSKPLSVQGVRAKSVLWIQTRLTPFAATQPQGGAVPTVVFRGKRKAAAAAEADLLRRANEHLSAQIQNAGLGTPAREL
jgi:hypothetical protein